MNIPLRQSCSRRNFLTTAAGFAFTRVAPGFGQSYAVGTRKDKILAYVGSVTSPVDGGSNGEGIYRFEINTRTGQLSNRKLAAAVPNPTWIVIHPSRKYLYSVNEIVKGNSGTVSAFAIDQASGNLTALNVVSSEGLGPTHVSLDPSGRYMFVANYAGGSIAVLPILAGGLLGSAVDVHRDSGSIGVRQATDSPNGSFAISGHDAPHPHMIAVDPNGRFVLATDLGQDRIYVYRFDSGTGKLTPSDNSTFVALPAGDGPRHFVFHPNGHWLYVLMEESSTIVSFRYDTANGTLALQEKVSTLPVGFAGTSFASEILISRDSRFLYAANRLHDTIAVFRIESNGRLNLVGETSTMGDYPRYCTFDPSGDFFYVCNQRSDSIASFKVHRDTGLLTFMGQYTPVGTPSFIAFLA
jgi:6-phosphogluconolactonase